MKDNKKKYQVKYKKKDEQVNPSFPSAYGAPMYYTGVQQVSVPPAGGTSDVMSGLSGGLSMGQQAAQFAPDPYSKAAVMAAGAGIGLYKGFRDKGTKNIKRGVAQQTNANVMQNAYDSDPYAFQPVSGYKKGSQSIKAYAYGTQAMKMEDGGEVPSKVVEVEKDELRLKRMGNKFKLVRNYKGEGYDKHSEGGELDNAEEGDIIIPAKDSKYVLDKVRGGDKSTKVGGHISGNDVYDIEATVSKLPKDDNTQQFEDGTKKLSTRMKQEQAVRDVEGIENKSREEDAISDFLINHPEVREAYNEYNVKPDTTGKYSELWERKMTREDLRNSLKKKDPKLVGQFDTYIKEYVNGTQGVYANGTDGINPYQLSANYDYQQQLPAFGNFQEMQDYFRANQIDPRAMAQNRGFYEEAGGYGWGQGLATGEPEFVAAQEAGLGDKYNDIQGEYFRNFNAALPPQENIPAADPRAVAGLPMSPSARTGNVSGPVSVPEAIPSAASRPIEIPASTSNRQLSGAISNPVQATNPAVTQSGGMGNFGNAALQIGEALPSLYNTGMGLFGNVDTIDLGRMDPKTPQYRDLSERDRQSANESSAIARYNMGKRHMSRGQGIGEASNIERQRQGAMGRINQGEARRYDAIQQAGIGIENQAQQYNLQQQDAETQYLKRGEGAKQNMLAAGLTGGAGLAQNALERGEINKRNNLQYGMDLERINYQRKLMGQPPLTPEEMQQQYLSPYRYV